MIIEVAVPYKLNRLFSYESKMTLRAGDVVEVSFGKKMTWALVVKVNSASKLSLKPVLNISEFSFSPNTMEYYRWFCAYNFSNVGLVAKLFLSPLINLHKNPLKKALRVQDICYGEPSFSLPQSSAIAKIKGFMKKGDKPVLLHGVTGAGKTEIYYNLAFDNFNNGKSTLIMLPEIALSRQMITKFKARFGVEPIIWHSSLTPMQRSKNLSRILNEAKYIVIGVRSSLNLNFNNLGLIVVDEEHDSAYKQETEPIYNARDMGIVRGKIEGAQVLLASATPAMETLLNCKSGKYYMVRLDHKFHDNGSGANINVIDLRKDKLKKDLCLTDSLVTQIKKSLAQREQALIYLNRKGYAILQMCTACGQRLECPNCSVWLIEHRKKNLLLCHYCGFSKTPIATCESCGEHGTIKACGVGVERLEEEVAKTFPAAKIGVCTADLSYKEQVAVLDSFGKEEIDILIGTQILAKGHHFPKLTTVGVVDGSMGSNITDIRANERFLQLLQQLSGRAGREKHPGTTIVQTYHPQSYVIKALVNDDYTGFAKEELAIRELTHTPPFTQLINVTASGLFEKSVETAIREVYRKVVKLCQNNQQEGHNIIVMPPLPAVLYILRKEYRWRFLIRGKRQDIMALGLKQLFANVNSKSCNIAVDVDPYSFL